MIISHSQFLQALGWATVNSFWQMAALWVLFLIANYLFTFSPRLKYLLATACVLFGFAWFLTTFCRVYLNSTPFVTGFSSVQLAGFYLPVLNYISIAYLSVLVIPGYRLFLSWRFLKVLREQQLKKADISYRLFVQKMSSHLGIRRKISIFVSALVESPVTIGYLKPIILLPIASANHLSTQQVEAILLHELVHIKRYDYVLNLLISTIQTLLYFNPFLQLFTQVVDEERENCCDLAVLQFGYDKMSYANALLKLEKLSVQSPVFALRAIGRKNLRSRIEKIVGVQKVPTRKFQNFGSLSAAIILIVGLNLLALNTGKNEGTGLSFNNWVNPFYFIQEEDLKQPAAAKAPQTIAARTVAGSGKSTKRASAEPPATSHLFPAHHPFAIYASFPQQLNLFEKETHVEQAVEATKIVLETVQWKEIEQSIGDGLTDEEKLQVKEEYLEQVNLIDWNGLQTNLVAGYDQINWQRLELDLKALLSVAAGDSLYIPPPIESFKENRVETAPVIAIIDSSAHQIKQAVTSPDTLMKPKLQPRSRTFKISL